MIQTAHQSKHEILPGKNTFLYQFDIRHVYYYILLEVCFRGERKRSEGERDVATFQSIGEPSTCCTLYLMFFLTIFHICFHQY